MDYMEFKKQQENQANEYTKGKIYFILEPSKDLVIKRLNEYGLKPGDVVGIGAGAYIKKEYYKDTLKFSDKQAKELKEYTLNNLNEVLTYEFANYELEISLSYTYKSFLIEVLGFNEKEIQDNKKEINKAIKEYREDFYKHN